MGTIYVVGNVNVDVILGPHGQWPQLGTETLLEHMELRVGGSAGNALLALHALQANVHAVASTGTDTFGDWLRHELRDVPGTWLRTPTPTSITVALTHTSNERTFFTHLGHLQELGWEHVRPALETATAQDVILLAGAFLTPRLRAEYPTMLQALKSHGARIAIDPGWPPEGWTADVRDEVLSWLHACDHLLINEQELHALTQHQNPETAATTISHHLPPHGTLIIKRGPHGATAWHNQHTTHAPAPPVTVIDTVGAGDTFNAAYLWATTRGATTEQALREGVHVASHAISTSPRRYSPAPAPSA